MWAADEGWRSGLIWALLVCGCERESVESLCGFAVVGPAAGMGMDLWGRLRPGQGKSVTMKPREPYNKAWIVICSMAT